MTRFDGLYSRFLEGYAYPRQLRSYKTGSFPDTLVYRDGKELRDFSSNDYLGLAKHPYLIAKSQEFAKRWGTSSSSSRLVRGNLAIYEQLEETLADALGKECALILGSGFQANATIIEALLDEKILGAKPLVFCDKACHASIYSGLAQLSHFHRFRHNDLKQLKAQLEKTAASTQPKFIFVEVLYSMEGDHADLKALCELAAQHQALLYVDDAHGVGVEGEDGWGKSADFSDQVDLIMGTFSKALGSFGAYLACSKTLRDFLLHRCKGLIYSTGLAPPNLGAIAAALELLPSLQAERGALQLKAQRLRQCLSEQGLSYGQADSHIVPWIIGKADKTRLAAQLLEEQGILGAAIQAPTVPSSQCRIRFCLSALHSENDLDLLFSCIQKLKTKLKL